MGNGYNQQQQQHLHERSTYLPMLCSRSRFTSIKDVHLPKCQHHYHHHLHLSSSSKSNDPSSPRVSCMGQVNRNNSRVIGLPTSYRFTTTTTNIKYHKLKRLFSGRNLTTTTTTTAAATRGRGHIKSSDDNDYGPAPVNIAALDPPLPVVKRVQQQAVDGGDGVNLWKRRSGGAALKNLQLQQIHIPNNNNNNNDDNHYLQPTTV
ncbi:uncharacterized protein LOC114313938 [Camellia sinensis]|uniref:Uncharacterized protein n=1 Tax=Camellia sinensis var. sinensis TaxID=542762 RepID=A0A4S4D885_CAMSN|nr:uncharacterized protein LOC114313938 [Camellia sinensis]THF98664.1 hypothetical protein TEA_026753 [Camellia sinensis var. sinensis]